VSPPRPASAAPSGTVSIVPCEVRYIKLGTGGGWARQSIENGWVSFGYHEIPHQVCVADDWVTVRKLLSGRGSAGAITAGVNEVAAFYEMGSDCLWITFAEGHLWWTFAEQEVVWIGTDPEDPSRYRRAIGGWRNTDLLDRPLRTGGLSSKLTQVAGFRSTICTVTEEEYLVRRINAVDEPVVSRARDARRHMMEVAEQMISGLHWADYETLADLVLSRSGWQRVTRVGNRLIDVDIVMEQPTTRETAFVQVKSRADQAVLDDYLRRFRGSGHDRFFFVCHSARGALTLPSEVGLHLLEGPRLAEAVVRNGLFDWLVERSQ
jgi:hypothetical protein